MKRKRLSAAAEARRLFLRRRPSDALPDHTHLNQVQQELIARQNVVGSYIGHKVTRGRQRDGLALVCIVDKKLKARELDPAERIPRRAKWRTPGGREFSCPTDVVTLDQRVRHSSGSYAGPGDDVTIPGDLASVGVALQHPVYGVVFTTAGHLVVGAPGVHIFPPGQQPRVTVANARNEPAVARARALKAVRVDGLDYALLTTPDIPSGNFFRDSVPLGNPYIPSPDDIGRHLIVLSSAGLRHTAFRGASASLPGNGFQLRNVLLTDFCTDGGDSGACLVDTDRRVWGFLIGAAGIGGRPFSVFMPVMPLLTAEQARFL